MKDILISLKSQIDVCKEFGEPWDMKSWQEEYGVLLTAEEATRVVNIIEQINAPEQSTEKPGS